MAKTLFKIGKNSTANHECNEITDGLYKIKYFEAHHEVTYKLLKYTPDFSKEFGE